MQKRNSFLYWIKVVSLGIVLGLGLQFAQAWTAPTQAPPLGNVGGPVTLGDGAQYKTGKLGVNSAITPTSALEVGSGGNVLVGGKAYSAATVDTDLASTLATKGYVDGKVGATTGSIVAGCKIDYGVSELTAWNPCTQLLVKGCWGGASFRISSTPENTYSTSSKTCPNGSALHLTGNYLDPYGFCFDTRIRIYVDTFICIKN